MSRLDVVQFCCLLQSWCDAKILPLFQLICRHSVKLNSMLCLQWKRIKFITHLATHVTLHRNDNLQLICFSTVVSTSTSRSQPTSPLFIPKLAQLCISLCYSSTAGRYNTAVSNLDHIGTKSKTKGGRWQSPHHTLRHQQTKVVMSFMSIVFCCSNNKAEWQDEVNRKSAKKSKLKILFTHSIEWPTSQLVDWRAAALTLMINHQHSSDIGGSACVALSCFEWAGNYYLRAQWGRLKCRTKAKTNERK